MIDVQGGWNLLFGFYVFDVPVPGTSKFVLQNRRGPDGECRVARHFAERPWLYVARSGGSPSGGGRGRTQARHAILCVRSVTGPPPRQCRDRTTTTAVPW